MKRYSIFTALALLPLLSHAQNFIGAELQPVSNYSVEYDSRMTTSSASSLLKFQLFNITPLGFWQHVNEAGNFSVVKLGYMREHYRQEISQSDSYYSDKSVMEETWHNVFLKFGYGQEGRLGPLTFDFGLEVPVVFHPKDVFTVSGAHTNGGVTTSTDEVAGKSKFNVEYGLGAFLFLHAKMFGKVEGGINFSLDYTYWNRTYNITETTTSTDGMGNNFVNTYEDKDVFKTFTSTPFFPSLVLSYKLD